MATHHTLQLMFLAGAFISIIGIIFTAVSSPASIFMGGLIQIILCGIGFAVCELIGEFKSLKEPEE